MKLFLVLIAVATSAYSQNFKKDVAPILEQQCLPCHNASKAAGGLALTSRKALLDRKAIVPGKPDDSPIYKLVTLPADRKGAMPPGGPRLDEDKLGVLKQWIEQGAAWPEDVLLTTAASGAADEHEIVRHIHERIQSHQPAGTMQTYKVTIPNTLVSYGMAPIPAGDFTMGSSRKKDEQPEHAVHVNAFWMQVHEVTWDEYRLFMFANQAGEIAHKDELMDAVSRPTRPYVEMSFGMGINGFPAISMTQHAANKYAEWLSAKTGEFYRLPTEAEWEYACRAGAGDGDPSPLGDYAWYAANSNDKYHTVATKKPNAWGLYDMLGNVMEWTLDQYEPYKPGPAANPWVKATALYPHSVRGGSWNDPADMVRCAARVASDPSWKQQDPQLPKSIWYETDAQWLGFRLVRPLTIPSADEMYEYWNSGVERLEP